MVRVAGHHKHLYQSWFLKISSGTSFDTDVYGAQQHAPLGELMVEI